MVVIDRGGASGERAVISSPAGGDVGFNLRAHAPGLGWVAGSCEWIPAQRVGTLLSYEALASVFPPRHHVEARARATSRAGSYTLRAILRIGVFGQQRALIGHFTQSD